MRCSPVILCLLAVYVSDLSARVFYLPENGDTVIGELQYHKAKSIDTFPDLARRYNIGFNQIAAANPEVDPWLPDEASHIIIPSRFILPEKPWEGIVVNLAEMRLYYFPLERDRLGKRLVYTFPVGIGRKSWPTPTGKFHVSEKIKDPVWTVPATVIQEALAEGVVMSGLLPPGEKNPLGKYVLLLNERGYLLHGTNKPFSIGRRISHGCLRLYPEDIEQLVKHVPRGTTVRIIDSSVVAGLFRDVVFVAAFGVSGRNIESYRKIIAAKLLSVNTGKLLSRELSPRLLSELKRSINTATGLVFPVTSLKNNMTDRQDLYLQTRAIKDPAVVKHLDTMSKSFPFATHKTRCLTSDDSRDRCYRLGPLANTPMIRAVRNLFMRAYGLAIYPINQPG